MQQVIPGYYRIVGSADIMASQSLQPWWPTYIYAQGTPRDVSRHKGRRESSTFSGSVGSWTIPLSGPLMTFHFYKRLFNFVSDFYRCRMTSIEEVFMFLITAPSKRAVYIRRA